ncbi:flavodoxin family protein [Sporanaerobacter sp. PP17-6a]|uniref:flavodoxin family protein n=1 Tax=Sporanaerobacter sp. PP17-6a TaxID=1891289 RepID=UPI00089FB394|nr:flavodoxin family protein [Sporanaerobacter sp. PP17-6a]SCL87821.1 flavodoxin [Sporanaerobacter sp. PP17-6a]
MKALIVYSSFHHFNTKKVAERISAALDGKLIKDVDFDNGMIGDYDLIGFGSGIYAGRYHKNMRNIIENADLKGKNVFVFSTRGSGNTNCNDHAIKSLKEKGANVLGEFSCTGYDTFFIFKLWGGFAKGHPDEEDLKNAEKFTHTISDKFNNIN